MNHSRTSLHEVVSIAVQNNQMNDGSLKGHRWQDILIEMNDGSTFTITAHIAKDQLQWPLVVAPKE